MSTRLSCIASSDTETSYGVNSSDAVHGKRKSRPIALGKGNDQSIKRRKRESSDTEKLNVISNGHFADEAASVEATHSGNDQDMLQYLEAGATLGKNTAHIRFGSEEPILPGDGMPDERPEAQQTIEELGSESGDEAPETFDNSAQLQKMKAESLKQDDVKKRFVANVYSGSLKLTIDLGPSS